MKISAAKKLEIITKHGRKFAMKPNGSSPVLEGIRYLANGSVVVTDRHRLLRIGGAHNFTEEFTSHAVTGAPIDGVYPDTSKIIPQELPTQITLISGFKRDDVKDAIARVKLVVEATKVSGDKFFITTLATTDGIVKLTIGGDTDGIQFSAVITADTYGPDEAVSLNADYLLSALNVFKDVGSARVIIGLTGKASPIVLRDEDNEIDVVVLPFRRAS